MSEEERHLKQVQDFLRGCDLWRKSEKQPVVVIADEAAIRWLLDAYRALMGKVKGSEGAT